MEVNLLQVPMDFQNLLGNNVICIGCLGLLYITPGCLSVDLHRVYNFLLKTLLSFEEFI